MKDSECIFGAKVICRDHNYINKIGNIYNINRNGFGVISYTVTDGSSLIGNGPWYSLNCWDLYQEDSTPNTLRSGSLPPPQKTECPCGILRTECDYHK